jgi:hypothetical protein
MRDFPRSPQCYLHAYQELEEPFYIKVIQLDFPRALLLVWICSFTTKLFIMTSNKLRSEMSEDITMYTRMVANFSESMFFLRVSKKFLGIEELLATLVQP